MTAPLRSARRARPFIVGANMPWGAFCGHDFGLRPHGWGEERQDFGAIERTLQELRAHGITVVRWFLLASGVNYPCRTAGAPFDPSSSAAPAPLSAEFLDDFITLCRLCQRHCIQLIPSLLSFEWFQPLEHKAKGVHAGGRGKLIFGAHGTDGRDHVRAFLHATLTPLLDRTTAVFGRPGFDQPAHPIFAWESINEPDWVTEGGPHLIGAPLHPVRRAQMNLLLAEHRALVLDAGYDHTIGFKQFEPKWLDPALKELLMNDRERYWHQGHHYPTLGLRGALEDTLATNQRLPAKPATYLQCLVGEFATQRGGRAWDVLKGDNRKWQDPELKQSEANDADYLFGRWQLIAQRGYDGGLLWAAKAPAIDRRTRWDDVTRRQTLAFSRAIAQES